MDEPKGMPPAEDQNSELSERADRPSLDPQRVYEELCTNIRVTDEISFKLLGAVPIVSGLGSGALALLTETDMIARPEIAVFVLSLLGLWMTYGLYVWERRNIQKCKWLIICAANLEDDQGPQQYRGFYNQETVKTKSLETTTISSISCAGTECGKTQAEELIYAAAILTWFVPMTVALNQLI